MNSISLWKFMPLTKKEVFINNNFIINIKDLCKFPRDFLDYILSCTSYFILNQFYILFKDWTSNFSVTWNKERFQKLYSVTLRGHVPTRESACMCTKVSVYFSCSEVPRQSTCSTVSSIFLQSECSHGCQWWKYPTLFMNIYVGWQ